MSFTKSLAFLCSLPMAAPQLSGQAAGMPPVPRFHAVLLETPGQPGTIGSEEARSINASGETAGQVFVPGSAQAARWSADGQLTVLGTTGGCTYSSASAINDAGAVVGSSLIGAPDNAFLWTPTGGTVALPLPSRCYPAGILVDGTIALTATLPGAQAVGATWHPLWGVHRIALPGGEVHVQDLSASGAVVGFASFPGSGTHAFLWTSAKGLVDLGTPVGFDISQAHGLNDQGLVVGLSRSTLSDQATVWQEGVGPALLAYARSSSTQSAAYAVNAQGWIVGSEYLDPQSYPRSFAVLWVDGVPFELTGLVAQEPGQPPVHVSIALDVNDQGQIAARGLVGGVQRALRLDPL